MGKRHLAFWFWPKQIREPGEFHQKGQWECHKTCPGPHWHHLNKFGVMRTKRKHNSARGIHVDWYSWTPMHQIHQKLKGFSQPSFSVIIAIHDHPNPMLFCIIQFSSYFFIIICWRCSSSSYSSTTLFPLLIETLPLTFPVLFPSHLLSLTFKHSLMVQGLIYRGSNPEGFIWEHSQRLALAFACGIPSPAQNSYQLETGIFTPWWITEVNILGYIYTYMSCPFLCICMYNLIASGVDP